MADRVVIVEREPGDRTSWRYGLADAAGALGRRSYRLREDPSDGLVPVGDYDESLWPTVILLVRQAQGRDRIVYNLRPATEGDAPEPPPRSLPRRWERATSGKAKGWGETLQERAGRDHGRRPRAAA